MALHYGYELPLAAITQQLELTNPSGAKAYVVNARRKLNLVMKRRALRKQRLLCPEPPHDRCRELQMTRWGTTSLCR